MARGIRAYIYTGNAEPYTLLARSTLEIIPRCGEYIKLWKHEETVYRVRRVEHIVPNTLEFKVDSIVILHRVELYVEQVEASGD